MLLVWVVGGAITLCGALSIGELAASFPQTGGLYVYLREGWGRLPAFLFGWSQLVLIRAAAVGSISTVFGEYLLRSIGIDPTSFTIALRTTWRREPSSLPAWSTSSAYGSARSSSACPRWQNTGL